MAKNRRFTPEHSSDFQMKILNQDLAPASVIALTDMKRKYSDKAYSQRSYKLKRLDLEKDKSFEELKKLRERSDKMPQVKV